MPPVGSAEGGVSPPVLHMPARVCARRSPYRPYGDVTVIARTLRSNPYTGGLTPGRSRTYYPAGLGPVARQFLRPWGGINQLADSPRVGLVSTPTASGIIRGMNDSPRFGWQDDSAAEPRPWADWPRCPRCGTRRDTACPDCTVPGADFALAELDPAADLMPLPRDEAEPRRAAGPGTTLAAAAGRPARMCADHGDGSDDESLPASEVSAAAAGGPVVMFLCPTCDEAFCRGSFAAVVSAGTTSAAARTSSLRTSPPTIASSLPCWP